MKRAKSLLVEDAAAAAKQVLLQTAYPGHNVVMCEAGCYGRANRLVQFTPIVLTNVAPSRTLEPTSARMPIDNGDGPGAREASAANAPATVESGAGTAVAPMISEEITCVAGCYGFSRGYKAASRSAALDATRAEVEAQIRKQAAAGDGLQPSSGYQLPRGATGAAASRWMTTSARAQGEVRASPQTPASPEKKKRSMSAKSDHMNAGRRASSPSGEWFQQINSDRSTRPY